MSASTTAKNRGKKARSRKKIAAGKKLSPILLVRGAAIGSMRLEIADGYHRVCASYVTDENTDIPCRLVSWQ